MKKIEIIKINDSEKWDKNVKKISNYDVYYLSSYAKGFMAHGDGEPFLVYYEDDSIRAINVVMERDIARDQIFQGLLPEKTYYDFATPYGYGGFLIDGEATEEKLGIMEKEYCSLCKDLGVVSEFVRFHPILKNDERLDNIYDISRLGKTISMDLKTVDVICNNLTSENRNMIRKAKKSGVEIFWGRSLELFEKFKVIYDSTMTAINAKSYYFFEKEYYQCFLKELKYNALVFYALYKGQIIAMSIILLCNKKMHYHLSGSVNEYRHLAPTNLLLYEAALWGYENGFETFHLGGGLGSHEDSLYKFKKSFNKKTCNTFSMGKKIFDGTAYDFLVSKRSNLMKLCKKVDDDLDFFPKYREK